MAPLPTGFIDFREMCFPKDNQLTDLAVKPAFGLTDTWLQIV
jgi:hypothetical protein